MAEDVAGLLRLLGIETADVFGYRNDRQIVSGEWVRAATGADNPSDQASYYGYRYFWWLDVDRPGRFYAFGKYGQFIYVAPDADAVVVRLGRSSGVDRNTWLATFRDVIDQLERRP
jgi:CubicO group peptidase (beta-lactamase class C family)